MSIELERELSIPLTMDDKYTPQEMLKMSRVLREYCSRLEETVDSRLIIKKDAMEIASELYDMVERIGWYALGQISKGELKASNVMSEIIANATQMHTALKVIMMKERPKGFEYKVSEITRDLEETYYKMTEQVA